LSKSFLQLSLGGTVLAAVAIGEHYSIEATVNAMVKLRKTYFPERTNQKIYGDKQKVYEKIFPAIKTEP
jgi:ribulose kinase